MALYFSLSFFLSSSLRYFFIFCPLWDLLFLSSLYGQHSKRTSTHFYLLTTLNKKVMTLYECLCQCSIMCNDQAQHAAKILIAGKAQLHAGYEIMQGNMTMKDKSYEHEEQWMLHDNISRKGYGNALIGRYHG